MKYLVDTDWVIHWLHGNERVRDRLERAVPEGIGFSMISLAELYEGVFTSDDPVANQRHLENTLRGVDASGDRRGHVRDLRARTRSIATNEEPDP